MTELNTQTFFSGENDPHPDDLGKAEVTNFTLAVDRTLRENFDWDGKAIGAVGLTLNRDNTKVEMATFITRGETELSEFSIGCDQVWQGAAESITLTISVPTLSAFSFSHGGLWSDFIPGERFLVAYHDRSVASATPLLVTPTGKGRGEQGNDQSRL